MNWSRITVLTFIVVSVLWGGCGKEFLDVQKSKKMVIPTKLGDLQALMDHAHGMMNSESTDELGIIGSDEYYMLQSRWELLSDPIYRNAYIWAVDVYANQTVNDWNTAYQRILYANLTLEGIQRLKLSTGEQADVDNLKGIALFHRGLNHYKLARLFCKPYGAMARHDMGIPIRLITDVEEKVVRSSVDEVYTQVLRDLEEASTLLYEKQVTKMRPNRGAALGLLARVFLNMDRYEDALAYALSCIEAYGELLDYNELDFSANYPFPSYGETNTEVLFMSFLRNVSPLNFNNLNIDTALMERYEENDLRQLAYIWDYNDRKIFKGSYAGNYSFFTGVALDEIYLIVAECYARLGQQDQALLYLNALRRTRFSIYQEVDFVDDETLLRDILLERQIQLLFRGLRWEDLRRFNKDDRFAKTLQRQLGGETNLLAPDDKRWVWPIPQDVIELSGLPQNER